MKMTRIAHLAAATAVAAGLAVSSVGQANPAPASQRDFAGEILRHHNGERQTRSVAPLRWNAELEADARRQASMLASRGVLQHSSYDTLRGQGENLWAGTAGHYSPDDMIGAFLTERRHFRPGRFPRVSATGQWYDVGHYTQIIWPGTREVGCAVARGHGNDFMVCRYWPAGNVIGEPVG